MGLDLNRQTKTSAQTRPPQKRKSPTADQKYIWCNKCWLMHPEGACDRDFHD